MTNKSKVIALCAITLTLIIVLGALPFVFLVPVLYTACSRKWGMSIIASTFYGVVSLCYAFMGSSFVSLAFIQAPYIAIVPRIFVGIIAHGSFVLSQKFFKGESRLQKILPISIATSLGSIANTALVILGMIIFLPEATFGGITLFVYIPTMLIFGVIELIVTNIIVPPLVIAVNKAVKI